MYTKELVNYLAAEGVRATFFVNGVNMGNLLSPYWGNVIRDIVNAGHQVALHTWTHSSLETASSDIAYAEVMNLEETLHGILGFTPTYLRPPFGATSSTSLTALGKLGFTVWNWNLDSLDWDLMDVDKEMAIYKNALDNASSSSSNWIALNHDIHELSATQLAKEVVKYVKTKGYTFTTVAQCVGDSDPYKTF